jgi:hypothetical protein
MWAGSMMKLEAVMARVDNDIILVEAQVDTDKADDAWDRKAVLFGMPMSQLIEVNVNSAQPLRKAVLFRMPMSLSIMVKLNLAQPLDQPQPIQTQLNVSVPPLMVIYKRCLGTLGCNTIFRPMTR